MNRFKSLSARLALVPAATLAAAGAAPAAVPTDVTDALGAMNDDALVVAGLVLVAFIAVAAFKFMRKGF